MATSKRYPTGLFTESAYSKLRNVFIQNYTKLALLDSAILAFEREVDIEILASLLMLTISVIYVLLILILDSYKILRKKLLFLISELVNISFCLYGLTVSSSHFEVYLIISTVSTCNLQLVRTKKLQNVLIILKLVVMWYLGSWILGYIPHIAIVFLIASFTSCFSYTKYLETTCSQALYKLQRMKAQFDKLIQPLADSMLILSEKQEIIFFNPACQRLFQADTPEKIKESLLIIKYNRISSESSSYEISLYESAMRYLESNVTSPEIFGVNELNGNIYEWHAAKGEWEDYKAVILTAHDITAFVSYERVKDESKTILMRTVSHDIKSPTNTLVELSDSLIEQHSECECIEKVKIMNTSAKLLLNFIHDMLDFSNIVANRFTINRCEVNIRDFITETYKLFEMQSKHKNLDYRCFIDPLIPEIITTDPYRLRQVIINLLSNSLKFTLYGKIRLEALFTEHSTMLIRVLDTGIGIPAHELPNLFEGFYTPQDLRLNPHGCGLGLYISNKFVRMLGDDKIHVISRLNEGSEFYFEVDIGVEKTMVIESTEEIIREESIIEERGYISAPRNMTTRKSFSPIRPAILVVDDSEFSILVMKSFLTSAGYQFEVARSGIEAVEKVLNANSKGAYMKVVFMDREMPGMTGPEAAKEIARLYEEKRIVYLPHIICYSADDTEESMRLCEESGMKEFLCKSSSKTAFLNIVRKYLLS